MRFTLRDLFWLTIVSALGVGWFCDHRWDKPKSSFICKIPANPTGDVLQVNNDVVEVSLGYDDGLKPGHELHVTRGNKYLGKITIRMTGADRAFGEINPKLQRGEIQQGDTVSWKLG